MHDYKSYSYLVYIYMAGKYIFGSPMLLMEMVDRLLYKFLELSQVASS